MFSIYSHFIHNENYFYDSGLTVLIKNVGTNTGNMTPENIIALGEIKAMKDFVVKPPDKVAK